MARGGCRTIVRFRSSTRVAAFLRETRRVQLIEDGEVVAIRPEGVQFVSVAGGRVRDRDEMEVDWDDEAAEKQGYETFMLKEIYEQPQAIADTIGVRDTVLYRAGDGTTDGEQANVSLALLEPKFHDGFGRWYCDIGINPTGAFKLGVQLHLARFQQNAIAGCMLSRTTRADAFMLHQPWTFSAVRREPRLCSRR